ncbi:MAG TPA: PKD domain-containing protein [Candidatus Saccharimonadales bacterium]|nr:PKD domain-containing protein [Candidatus Saccharimonadales bacterium]
MARSKTKKRAAKSVKRKKLWFVPYPLFLFILLLSGVYLVAWTFNAHADDLVVNAIVKDKQITDPAVITFPANGDHFKAVPITVDGTCPDYGAYVEIFDNNVMRGSAICDNSKQFTLQIDLFAAQNKLEAHVFNLTDDEGPVSAPVTVYYDVPPAPQPNLQTTPAGSSGKTSPLLLQTAFVYKGYYTNQEVVWPLEISGGSPPYALSVDWGDGRSSIISRPQAGQFNINHIYKQPPDNKLGNYTVKVQASDAAGNYTYLQFFVIVNVRNQAGASGSIYSKGPPSLGGFHQWVWAVWPFYAALVLMAISFKLGEHEESLLIKKRQQIRRA